MQSVNKNIKVKEKPGEAKATSNATAKPNKTGDKGKITGKKNVKSTENKNPSKDAQSKGTNSDPGMKKDVQVSPV